MTLNSFFAPKSVVVIGASHTPQTVGHGVVENLLGKRPGAKNKFQGNIFLVNKHRKSILGQRCFSSVAKIHEKIDLAIICVPASAVLSVVTECTAKKIPAAIIISAGFSEIGEKGRELQKELMKLARAGNMRIIGPNCLGVIVPRLQLSASFAPVMPSVGSIGLISQSGALVDSLLDWSLDHNVGFSRVVSVGNQADVSISELIKELGDDPSTKCIALYIEHIDDGRAFVEIAQKASKRKPIVAIKAGKSSVGNHAVSSHTGNLAGDHAMYEAAFRSAGIIEASTLREFLVVAETLTLAPQLRKNGIAIVTNGGGCGILCADACEREGIVLSPLAPKTIQTLDQTKQMHPAYSQANPLDIIGDAGPKRYSAAIDSVLHQEDVHGVIVIQTLQTMTDPKEDARVVVALQKKYPSKPILPVFLGGHYTKVSHAILESAGMMHFEDVSDAARAMRALLKK